MSQGAARFHIRKSRKAADLARNICGELRIQGLIEGVAEKI